MLTRRALLKNSVLTAAAAGFPSIIPGTALGLNGRPAPSERITMAAIGFGTIAYKNAIQLAKDVKRRKSLRVFCLFDSRLGFAQVFDYAKEQGVILSLLDIGGGFPGTVAFILLLVVRWLLR